MFADYEILQPFPQLGRATFRLTAAEESAGPLTRFVNASVPTLEVLGLERRGWRRGAAQNASTQGWMYRRVGGERSVDISVFPGIAVGYVAEFPGQRLDAVWATNRDNVDDWGDWQTGIKVTSLDPVTISELIRDLADLTA